jgi:hypothetical protein
MTTTWEMAERILSRKYPWNPVITDNVMIDVATPIITPAIEMKVLRETVRYRFLLLRYRRLMKN